VPPRKFFDCLNHPVHTMGKEYGRGGEREAKEKCNDLVKCKI